MLIRFNSNNIPVSQEMEATLSGFVSKALKRFESRITRVEVHLEDENSIKSGKDDKRCSIEIKAGNIEPIIVTSKSDNIIQSVREAANKSKASLDKKFGKMND
ncbi:MAG TPA: HPF/RaiA family ribosome-associated protein, partial [Bacteroidales bacterium]|nr:HPF/RaiA family ribosome-associated protein [Bacteroidales bacterium]